MIIPSFGEIEKITDSRYSLVMLVSRRAREIISGGDPLIDTKISKPVSVALEETLKGAVSFTTKDEAEEIKRLKEQEIYIEAEHKRLRNEVDTLLQGEEQGSKDVEG
ncbi:MAG: DNA-directed RNA polymerase subunit omega [Tissierellia bacterium]|nr:DNA-directed RNA polymerase subunit omega [Tissierellia bacterium]